MRSGSATPSPRATRLQRQAAAHRGHARRSAAAASDQRVDRPEAVQERAGAEPPDEHGQDRGAARAGAPRPTTAGSSRAVDRVPARTSRATCAQCGGHAAAPARVRAVRPSTRPAGQAVAAPAQLRSRVAAGVAQPARARQRAPRSSGGTSRPGRPPVGVRPERLRHPPTAVAITGSPRASASVTTMPYVSARDASTSTSAAAYARSRSSPVERAGEADPVGDPGRARPARRSRVDERRVAIQRPDADAAPRQVGDRRQRGEQHVVALVRGDRGDAEQLAAGRRSRRERRADRRPGSATWTASGGSAYWASSRRRVHALVVTTAAAADRTAHSRAARRRPRAGGPSPSGMCTSTTSRSRRACGDQHVRRRRRRSARRPARPRRPATPATPPASAVRGPASGQARPGDGVLAHRPARARPARAQTRRS